MFVLQPHCINKYQVISWKRNASLTFSPSQNPKFLEPLIGLGKILRAIMARFNIHNFRQYQQIKIPIIHCNLIHDISRKQRIEKNGEETIRKLQTDKDVKLQPSTYLMPILRKQSAFLNYKLCIFGRLHSQPY